jgi:ketosteroid isomerase-like protein
LTKRGKLTLPFLFWWTSHAVSYEHFFIKNGGKMMRYILGSLIVVIAVAAAAFGECSAADKAALEAFDRAWGTANENGDRAALMNIFAEDYTGLPGMQGKAAAIDGAVKAAEENRKSPNPDKVTHEHYYISCTPNSATITHRNTIWTANGTGGKPETFYTRSVHMLEKRGGKWLVVSNAGSPLDDSGVLWYLEQDWNTAFWKKDKAWFQNNWAADFSNISSETGKITDKDEEIAGVMGDKSTYDLVETKGMDINVDGKTARITGIFHLKGTDDKSKAFDVNMRYTDIWVMRDGRWQAWSSQGTYMK